GCGEVLSVLGELFGGGGGGARGFQPGRGADVETAIELELLDAIRGTTQTIALRRRVVCPQCKGIGGEDPKPCPQCEGRGQIRVGGGPVAFSRTCPRCSGSGVTYAKPCSRCGGSGHIEEVDRISVKIPPGVDEGSKIRLAGKGEP